VIPVPANEIVRADQNTTNAGFLHSLTNDLHLANHRAPARQIRIASQQKGTWRLGLFSHSP